MPLTLPSTAKEPSLILPSTAEEPSPDAHHPSFHGKGTLAGWPLTPSIRGKGIPQRTSPSILPDGPQPSHYIYIFYSIFYIYTC
ncbi:Hypothetical protein FKW44_015346 [Caligus rogercresseyi]|uniref:Uncharacterized protein n=1 Tax=Caligus rogercresseyi TaxID=217165 RepID=A0A7T8H0B9_CALRO|nr:Hypothetical protein FKW44_015346 [Caligus rogercresseyi]